MDNINTLFKNLFPLSIQIVSSPDLKDVSMWAGDLGSATTEKVFDLDYLKTVIGSKSPDALYEASLQFGSNAVNVSPVEGGYRFRFQCYDLPTLEEFVKAMSGARSGE